MVGVSSDPEELMGRAAAKTANRVIESWHHLRVENISKVIESNCPPSTATLIIMTVTEERRSRRIL